MTLTQFLAFKHGDFLSYERWIEEVDKLEHRLRKLSSERDMLEDSVQMLSESKSSAKDQSVLLERRTMLNMVINEIERSKNKLDELIEKIEECT